MRKEINELQQKVAEQEEQQKEQNKKMAEQMAERDQKVEDLEKRQNQVRACRG
jgi:hypothetical protein